LKKYGTYGNIMKYLHAKNRIGSIDVENMEVSPWSAK
jgi:hypothetical protein